MTKEQMRMLRERVAQLEAQAADLREQLDALTVASWTPAFLRGRLDALNMHPIPMTPGRMDPT